MSMIQRLLHPERRAETRGPLDDFWYQPVNAPVQSGVTVDETTAFNVAAVFACISLVAGTLGSLPLITYRRTARGKERAVNHPLYQVLHDFPSQRQTRMEFVEMLTGHAMLRGNGYARIVPGPRGPVDQLTPLHPDRVTVLLAEDGSPRYRYRNRDGTSTDYLEDEIFHLRGLSSNGYTGLSVLTHARETFGLALAAEGFAARLFSQGASPRGVLEHPGELKEGRADQLRAAWRAAHEGLANAHSTIILEDGMKWRQVGMSPEDSQMLGSRLYQISEVARWWHIPPHKVQELSHASFSNIEQQNWEFIMDAVRPWAVRWEMAILRSLIMAQDTYFAEFLLDAYLRGDTASRYAAYNVAINAGWMSPNEARLRENMNQVPGLDRYRVPLNMATLESGGEPTVPGASADVAVRAESEASHCGEDVALRRQVSALATEAAARVVRKEIVNIEKAARRCGSDQEAFRAWSREFYATHGAYVVQHLHLTKGAAERYAAEQCAAVVNGGRAVVESWPTERVKHLADLAMEVSYAPAQAE